VRHRWRLWVGLLVSAAALVLALLGIDIRQVVETLAQADYIYLIPACGALLAYLSARSIRWRILLGADVTLAEAFWVGNIGYLVSNVLPFRLGDPARAVAIGLGGKVKVSAALSTVVVERVLDMVMVVLLLAATLPFVGEIGWLRDAGLLAGAAALVALVVLIVLALRPDWVRRLVHWGLARVPRLDHERWVGVLDGFMDGLAALRSAWRAVGLLAWSIVSWVFVVAFYYAMLWAFLDRPSLVEGGFLSCAIGLGMAVPAAPGAMGVFHSVARYALELPFGVPEERAVAVAFASHAVQYIAMCVLGLIGLARQNLSLGRLQADVATTLAEENHSG
jgi:uncharacterized protein (TIRG00374 family)